MQLLGQRILVARFEPDARVSLCGRAERHERGGGHERDDRG